MHGGWRTERESDTFAPRRQMGPAEGPLLIHSLPRLSRLCRPFGFSILRGAGDVFAEDERGAERPESSTSQTEGFANRAEAEAYRGGGCEGWEMDGLARSLHQNLNDVSGVSDAMQCSVNAKQCGVEGLTSLWSVTRFIFFDTVSQRY